MRDASRDHEHDLYEPTLADRDGPDEQAAAPWRLDSQGYVAFFGGPLAAAAIGLVNGRRLGLTDVRLLAILLAGAAGLGLAIVAALALETESSAPRLLIAASGLASYAVTRRVQKPADRLYRLRRGEDAYDSLWKAGVLTVFGCGALTVKAFAGLP